MKMTKFICPKMAMIQIFTPKVILLKITSEFNESKRSFPWHICHFQLLLDNDSHMAEQIRLKGNIIGS